MEEEGLETDLRKTIPPENFYVCLRTYMETDQGEGLEDVIRFSNETDVNEQRIIGFKSTITAK